MQKLRKNILLCTLILFAVHMLALGLTALCGVKLRVWIREPVSIIIGIGTIAGLLQLILKIRPKALKVLCIVAWTAATLFCVGYGGFILMLSARSDYVDTYNGQKCLVEREPILWETKYTYYKYLGPFVRGTEILYSERS